VIEPLRVTVELDCPAEHAFTVWTARFGDWWPGSHTVSAAPGVTVSLEPRLGGRIYERAPDGTEHEWGEVTVWEPPRRLGYLWHLRRDRADATDVELSFVATGDDRCRLEIVHSGWERLGADADTWRTANRGGWAGLLPHFVTAINVAHKEEDA
jgi:Activator of Hsp90 ATPase homolog 1-like protein